MGMDRKDLNRNKNIMNQMLMKLNIIRKENRMKLRHSEEEKVVSMIQVETQEKTKSLEVGEAEENMILEEEVTVEVAEAEVTVEVAEGEVIAEVAEVEATQGEEEVVEVKFWEKEVDDD